MTTGQAAQPGMNVGLVPGCPANVLAAIYGTKPTPEEKKKAYETSLQRWWQEYADRKNDEEDEHVADSLLYDRSHLPRTIPAPDCVVVTPVPTKAPPPLKAAVVAPAVVVPAMVVPAAVPAAAAAAAQASVQVSQ